nr:MAG TPA: hypothetical protein [Caudoviricetes sp.]
MKTAKKIFHSSKKYIVYYPYFHGTSGTNKGT